MGPKRSLARLAKEVGKSKQLMERWSRKHQWVQRVEDYHKRMREIEEDSRKAEIVARAPEWADRQERHKEEEWRLRGELIEAGRRVLEKFRDGTREATLGDVARALELASHLGRLSSGLPREIKEVKELKETSLRVEWKMAWIGFTARGGGGATVEVQIEECESEWRKWRRGGRLLKAEGGGAG